MHILQSTLQGILELSAGAGQALGLVRRDFDLERILRDASRIAGSGPVCLTGELTTGALRNLLRSLDEEAGLSALGAQLARRKLTATVANRLQLETLLAQGGRRDAERLRDPVFIAGLPRTGTTLLHRLLAEHDELRPLRLGEVLEPFAASDAARERRAAQVLRAIRLLAPDAFAAHPMDAVLPAECQHLIEATFVAPFFVHYEVPRYTKWMMSLSNGDLLEACGHYRRLVEVATGNRGRLLSKAPAHALFGTALPATFPDMWVIRTHRSMASAVPSLASLVAFYRRMFSRRVDRERIGQLALDVFRLGSQRMIEMDERLEPDRSIDIDYLRFVADPVGTAMAVFDRLGLETSRKIEGKLRQRNRAERVHAGPARPYSLDQFGLTRADLAEATFAYSDWLGRQALL